MINIQLQPGDTVLASKDIFNDGSFPDTEESQLLVKSGTRGVIINQGYLEENENREVFLVKFEFESESTTNELGPPIGCWPEDIRAIADIDPAIPVTIDKHDA